jgi:hypothetical protein
VPSRKGHTHPVEWMDPFVMMPCGGVVGEPA